MASKAALQKHRYDSGKLRLENRRSLAELDAQSFLSLPRIETGSALRSPSYHDPNRRLTQHFQARHHTDIRRFDFQSSIDTIHNTRGCLRRERRALLGTVVALPVRRNQDFEKPAWVYRSGTQEARRSQEFDAVRQGARQYRPKKRFRLTHRWLIVRFLLPSLLHQT